MRMPLKEDLMACMKKFNLDYEPVSAGKAHFDIEEYWCLEFPEGFSKRTFISEIKKGLDAKLVSCMFDNGVFRCWLRE